MKRKLTRKSKDPIPRDSLDYLFDILNNHYQRKLKGEAYFNQEIEDALYEWEICDGEMCNECLFGKYQDWINDYNLVKVPDSSLCQLMVMPERLLGQRKIDLLDSGVVVPDNFEG